MVDQITKFLNKLTKKEQNVLKGIIEQIISSDFDDLNIKKLKGNDSIYRVRKGDMRVIFTSLDSEIRILTIERRSENTYRQY